MIAPSETAIGPPSTTARRLVNASLSDNTRRAYAGALGKLDAWLDGLRLEAIASALNSRPRKTLGWKTPAEALDDYLCLIRE